MNTAGRMSVMVLLALSAACVTQAKVEQAHIARRVVDLNEDGALEALQRSNPVHYDKVRKILDGVLRQRDAQAPRWIQTNFDGRDVSYGPIVLTSHPPKRRLSFALDATRYEAIIVLTNVSGEIVPAK
jgi:hypothetical protein